MNIEIPWSFCDEIVHHNLVGAIDTLESPTVDMPMWFSNDKAKDDAAVAHLIHCMKVVADYYSYHYQPKYFDYSSAK
jgi:hypothetical protein